VSTKRVAKKKKSKKETKEGRGIVVQVEDNLDRYVYRFSIVASGKETQN
jgi:hypothetical protein